MIKLVKRKINIDETQIILLDSIMMIEPEDAGAVVISSSHGGIPAAYYAMIHPIRAAFFNDAGVGRDRAGIAGLDFLEERGIPAGAVDHMSARIGDVEDMWLNGVISHLNPLASRRGLAAGMPLREAVTLL